VDGLPPADTRTGFVRTPDGRRLAFCEWGDPDGAPLFFLHGLPGSRYLRHVGNAYVEARLRVITYDRPGYGLSDPAPGRSVAGTANDVAAIAEHLRVDRFSVAGISAGGVHAFAVAAAFPDRVSRCVGLKALAPYKVEGLDFFAGMDRESAEELRLLVGGDREALTADAENTRAWAEGDLPELSAGGPVTAMLKQAFREAFRQGLHGHIDDCAALLRDHGYDVRSVVAPTWLLAAREDQQVPPGHARWLAEHLPNARLTWIAGGHLDDHEHDELQALAWAAHGTAPG
jgi:pimeloyl-ACP methyl ester carboxylesterase